MDMNEIIKLSTRKEVRNIINNNTDFWQKNNEVILYVGWK